VFCLPMRWPGSVSASCPRSAAYFRPLTVRENLTVFARAGRHGYWNLPRIFELFPSLRARESQSRLPIVPAASEML